MPFECEICGRKMNTTASYNAHKKTHKHYKCAICSENFNQKMKYMTHMGIHETGKVLTCNICGKQFGRSSNFYNHQRIHLGIKKFKCYICGHAFVKAANLDAHLLIHCDSDQPSSSKGEHEEPTANMAEKSNEVARNLIHNESSQFESSGSVGAVVGQQNKQSIETKSIPSENIFNDCQKTTAEAYSEDVDSDDLLFDNSQQTYSSYDSMYSL